MSIERKLRRANVNKKKKKAEKALAEKVALFGHLPANCLTCEKPFDKLDREQVMSWNVVVREKEGKVRLYCPECWDKAHEILEGFKKHLENKKER
ncbi:MAG: hypothetical protein GOVbin630_7 [Prokaryotic dsDNA virus sp.]|nr:MAG: hypothetical protein GOVbin630_7 [Prokaryotic dsDNA virus sp.]|tara:strand:- start:1039 stop:1323 length:285 start_codon:yes stop_codon:yes gene_type:complete